MITAVIITVSLQASRTPGAALTALSGRPAVEIMIERARRTPAADLVALAVPSGEAEDPLAEAALDAGALVVRPSSPDVAEGVALAAEEAGAQRIVHVDGVQPFFDSSIAGGVLALLADSGADIATNAAPALFPDGLDCEAFEVSLLAIEPANREARRFVDRLTGVRLANLRGPGGGLEHLRWRLEGAADIAFAQAVHAALGPAASTAIAAEIAGLCLRRGDIAEMNTALVDQARLIGRDLGAVQTRPVSFMRAA
ncbi:MAG: cytidylyltransferase domain-containing protein [Oceanicaulis sp.]